MSTYSDTDILRAMGTVGPKSIRIEPFRDERAFGDPLQPASVDLRLGYSFIWLGVGQVVDMRDRKVDGEPIWTEHGGYLDLEPAGFVLGTTLERVEIGSQIRPTLHGKSSIGRLGIAVHATAGYIDPGFRGQITLEIYNVSRNTVRLRPGMPICQISFDEMLSESSRPYGAAGLGSRYQDQVGVQGARS